ncbi:hypothetical protein HPB47_008935, partial [Ixodes persulcatus]
GPEPPPPTMVFQDKAEPPTPTSKKRKAVYSSIVIPPVREAAEEAGSTSNNLLQLCPTRRTVKELGRVLQRSTFRAEGIKEAAETLWEAMPRLRGLKSRLKSCGTARAQLQCG